MIHKSSVDPLNLEKRKLLDTLVFDSQSLERIRHATETLRLEIPFLNERLKAFSSEVRFQERLRKEHLLRKRETIQRRKKLASEISRLRNRIQATQRQLEKS